MPRFCSMAMIGPCVRLATDCNVFTTNLPLASLVGRLAAALRSAWVESTTRASVEPPLEVSDITREAILELGSMAADQLSCVRPAHKTARKAVHRTFFEVMNFL